MPHSIHIATDRPGPLMRNYLIAKLAWHWARAGHRITTGPICETDAELGLLHIDRTRIDSATVPANPTRRPFLNSRVLDISKHLFTTLRVRPGDGWTGPVIVKSNLNHFGEPERHLRPRHLADLCRRALARFAWRSAGMLPPRNYPVLGSPDAVPGWVWRNPELLVERFTPERAGDLYCLRGWVFFGKRSYTYRLFSKNCLVKTGTMIRHEFLKGPPPELEATRAALGFDFGKFDYVEVDGRTVLLDLNKTPTISTPADTPRLRDLAEGVDEFLA
jgi:hypothetical protein